MQLMKGNNMSFEKEINLEKLKEEKDNYLNDSKNTIIRHGLSKTKINDFVYSLDKANNIDFKFSIDIKTLPVTNQRQSGRCWIFSACNLLREHIAKKLGIKDMFEISQNYVAFYDKLEKINFTLEAIISNIDLKHDDRKMMFILQNGISDGGQWDMFVNLVKKYGIVPKANMVETLQSSFTMQMNRVINSSIREFAYLAQKEYQESKDLEKVYELKKKYMEKFYAFLIDNFGVPPEKFDFEYVDEDKNYHCIKDLTPQKFAKDYLGDFLDNYVSIIHAPTKDKEFNKTYTIELLGNVIEGKKVTHLNLELERLKQLIIKQLSKGELVWFGSDVSNYGVRENGLGLWDDQSFDYRSAFGLDISFEKEHMLDYFQSAMNHAMVLTGVNLVNGKPNRWKVENSWGEDIGKKGYFVISDSFFDKFVYQAAIDKKYLNKEELKALKGEPTILPMWDPFGTLAD